MALTRRWITDITDTTGSGKIIDNRPELQLAVKMRSPYVDALSLLQLRALRVLRSQAREAEEKPEPPEWRHLLLLSVSGVSAGLKNTG